MVYGVAARADGRRHCLPWQLRLFVSAACAGMHHAPLLTALRLFPALTTQAAAGAGGLDAAAGSVQLVGWQCRG